MARFGNQGLDHVAIGVGDVEHSASFYEEVLGLERTHEEWDGIPTVLVANGSGLALFPKDMHPGDGDGEPSIRILHIAFRLGREGFDAARSALPEHGIEPRFSDHRISHSLYFSDPDGHQIELTTYEV